MIAAILVSIATGLLVNELCDLSPWCARKLVHWSAFRRYPNLDRAEARAEELTALINDRPGKLFKLITALCFAARATVSPRPSARIAPARTTPHADTYPAYVLTWRQRKVLQVIRDSVQHHGHPPSMREIADAVGMTDISEVPGHLYVLECKDYLPPNATRYWTKNRRRLNPP